MDRKKAIAIGAVAAVVLLVVIVIGSSVSSYNRFVREEEGVTAQGKQVDVQYQRAFALLPRIESFAQQFLANETDLQARIAALRSGASAVEAGDRDAQDAYAQQMDETLLLLTGRVENYPNLRSGDLYQDLIGETTNTFNKIAFEKGLYNEKVAGYNAHLRECCIPMLVAGLTGFEKADYIGYSNRPNDSAFPGGEP